MVVEIVGWIERERWNRMEDVEGKGRQSDGLDIIKGCECKKERSFLGFVYDLQNEELEERRNRSTNESEERKAMIVRARGTCFTDLERLFGQTLLIHTLLTYIEEHSNHFCTLFENRRRRIHSNLSTDTLNSECTMQFPLSIDA